MALALVSVTPADETLGHDPSAYVEWRFSNSDPAVTWVTEVGSSGTSIESGISSPAADPVTSNVVGSGWDVVQEVDGGTGDLIVRVKPTGGWAALTNYGVAGEPSSVGALVWIEVWVAAPDRLSGWLGLQEFAGPTFTTSAATVAAPRVSSAEARSLRRVRVHFSEPMRDTSVLRDPTSYTFTPDGGSAAVEAVSATPSGDGRSVSLVLSSSLTPGTDNYVVEVSEDLESRAGIEMDLGYLTATFSVSATAVDGNSTGVPLIVIVEIEGIGNSSGTYRWCSRRPRRYLDYEDRVYFPDLLDWPATIEQQIDPLGGVSSGSELSVEIGDMGATGERMTALVAIQSRALTFLDADVSRSASNLTLVSNAGRVSGDIIYIGAEAMILGTNTSGTTWNVTRAALDTAAAAHLAGDAVLNVTPILFSRRMRLFVGINDGRHSSADEVEIDGGWALDKAALTSGLGGWAFSGRSQLKYLDRLLDRDAIVGALSSFDATTFRFTPSARKDKDFDLHFGDRIFFRIGDEIRQVTADTALLMDRLPVAGTRAREEWSLGDDVRQVYVARSDQTGTDYGSFRYQAPGDETNSRGTGTWVADSHAIVIMLCLLTGKAARGDYEVDNYTDGGNFSALPPGVGLGVPAAEIDFDSFYDLWHRTPHAKLDNFVLGETETGRAAIDRICRITGYELKIVNGLIAIDLARVPLADEVGPTWDASVMTGEFGDGNVVGDLSAELASDLAYGSVTFSATNELGDEVKLTYSDADFPEAFGARGGLYAVDERPLEIDAKCVRVANDGGDPEILRQRALTLLRLFRQPPWRYRLSTVREQRTVNVGELVRLTHPQIPDLVNGVRGVRDQVCKVLSKREVVSRQAVHVEWSLISYLGGRFGRITPTARISSVASNTATVSANRYTDPQARGGLPNSDAEAFAVGDRVVLRERTGVTVATTPAYQTVDSIGTNTITLDGNFGGAAEFDTGYLLELVERDDATTTEAERYVFLADAATRTVGTQDEEPWTWGEG